jgi:hypothetical protein
MAEAAVRCRAARRVGSDSGVGGFQRWAGDLWGG